MTKEDIFITIGYNYHDRKYDPFRRYFMRLNNKDLREIMTYIARKEAKYKQ